jgi:uncharacterized protein (TIGR00369 family)
MLATALDAHPTPPCARLLGWRLLDARPKDGWVKVAFEAKPEFCNPAGFIQGGFLAAMLDDVMGPAVFTHTEGRLYTASIDMTVQYLAAARPGPMFGEGQVVQLGKSVGFVEARLMDADGTLIARATESVRLIPAEKALG